MHGVFTKFLAAVPIKEKINNMQGTGSPDDLAPELKRLIDEARIHISTIFKQFDKDGSGFIDVNELAEVSEQLGMSMSSIDIHNMIMDLDKNRDGSISAEEFEIWWLSGRQGATGALSKVFGHAVNGYGKSIGGVWSEEAMKFAKDSKADSVWDEKAG